MSAPDVRLRKVSAEEAIARIIAARQTTPGLTREKWRAGIPWSNAEVAEAIEQAAETVPAYNSARYRRLAEYLLGGGRVSSIMLRIALPVLVKTCGVCGKTALYRIGRLGRCRTHRDVPDRCVQEGRLARERGRTVIEQDDSAYRRYEASAERLRQIVRIQRRGRR